MLPRASHDLQQRFCASCRSCRIDCAGAQDDEGFAKCCKPDSIRQIEDDIDSLMALSEETRTRRFRSAWVCRRGRGLCQGCFGIRGKVGLASPRPRIGPITQQAPWYHLAQGLDWWRAHEPPSATWLAEARPPPRHVAPTSYATPIDTDTSSNSSMLTISAPGSDHTPTTETRHS